MKKLFKLSLSTLLIFGFSFTACRKDNLTSPPELTIVSKYSTVPEFRQGIQQLVNAINANGIAAYLDTLANGYPNKNGRTVPLAQFGYSILNKLSGNPQQIESAVYDVFHFDGATFSLVSYLMKSQMVGDISAQTLANLVTGIPLPPIPVPGFLPPVEVVALGGDCCTDNVCNPVINILVTWTFKPPCGNYEKSTSGYAANNTLSRMSSGTMYRFDAEITGCPCPGTLTSSVSAPAGASYGTAVGKDGSVTILPVTLGTYTVTFTYKVCDKTVTKTFTIGVS